MLKILEQMKETIEAEIETPFPKSDYNYLEQIKTAADLSNFDMSNISLRDLAFDAAIVLGLTEEEAEAIAYPIEPIKKTPQLPKPTDQELEREYDQLRRDYSASASCFADAEYHLIEEISAEGFASKKTRQCKDHYETETKEDLAKLNTFKANNADFVTRLERERSEAKHLAMWNS